MYIVSMTTWKEVMVPVKERISLDEVGKWYLMVWDWRTKELAEGHGTGYDCDPKSRVNRSVIRLKFPWLTLHDETDLTDVIKKLRKGRGE